MKSIFCICICMCLGIVAYLHLCLVFYIQQWFKKLANKEVQMNSKKWLKKLN